MTYFYMYWIQILIALGVISATAGGFYLHKKYKEAQYKHEIEYKQDIYTLCVNKAVTPEDYQNCWQEKEGE